MRTWKSHQTPILSGLAIWIMLAGWSVLTATPAYACSCIIPPPPAEAMEDARQVFAGEVLEIEEVDTGMHIDVRIRVDEAWKGVEEQEITVRTPDNSAACGFNFEVGKEYLVYTSEIEGEIQVSLCSRTALLSDATDDLDVLGEGTPGSSLQPVDGGDVTQETPDARDPDDEDLNLWVLGGSVAGILGLVFGITLLRRRR